MNLFLEAIDVWLFRDGRPFDALSDHRAKSLFPPYPSVIQGAIRSHHLVIKEVDLQDKQKIAEVVGTAEDYKNLRIRGPFLARRESREKDRNDRIIRYFPQPADAVTVDKEKIKPASLPRAINTAVTSSPTTYLLGLDDEPVKGETNLWLAEEELLSYLKGEVVTGVSASILFQTENKFGIGRDDLSHTTKEGALYEVEFIRPCKNVGLLVEVNGYEGWPLEGTLRIGGEGRGAYFQQVEVSALSLPPEIRLPSCFKIYFATPAYFEGGWQSSGGNWGKFFEGEVELMVAALNRYESMSGYDWANDRQKPARRYVPAGSVYYFNSKSACLRPDLIQNAVTDLGAEIGFGQILVSKGVVKNV